MSEKKALGNVRQQIDDTDWQIQQLLNQRASLAQQVAQIKTQNGEQTNFYRPDREADVLRNVMQRNNGPLTDQEMARLFREIMSACLAAEKPLQVAYLGPRGSFTEAATQKQFGGSVELEPMATIADVFRAVETGQVCYGIVPVENSTEGVVSHTLDRFINSPAKINGEVTLRVHHYLLSKQQDVSDIKTIYAHPQTFAQCRQWLIKHLPNAELVPMSSNSESAKKVSESEEMVAAIASQHAADIYDLTVLKEKIEDEEDNTTRFLVIGDKFVAKSSEDKTSLLVSTKNQPGALQALLKPLADAGIGMTRIESRPSRKAMWEYVFFVDIEGHADDPTVAKALDALEKASSMFRILGSYPKAVL